MKTVIVFCYDGNDEFIAVLKNLKIDPYGEEVRDDLDNILKAHVREAFPARNVEMINGVVFLEPETSFIARYTDHSDMPWATA